MGGRQLGRKVVSHNSKSDFPLARLRLNFEFIFRLEIQLFRKQMLQR